MPPSMLCPHCHQWAPVPEWAGHPPPPQVPFTRTCPNCGTTSDVGDLDYRISPTTTTEDR